MKKFALTNGKVVSKDRVFDATVFVVDGRVDRVGEGHIPVGSGFEEIDVSGKHILPGLIDVHVHFRVPGMEEKEDWIHASKAALAGGVTTVLDMPNTNPPTVSAEALASKRALVRDKAMVNYGFYAGATVDNVRQVAKMKDIVGVKVYMGSSTGNLLVDDLGVLEKFMTETDHLLVLHAENEACIQERATQYALDDDPAVHSKIRDPECAYQAVRDALHLAKKHKRKVHLTHVSTAHELDVVRKFSSEDVTVDVTPHHLFLNKDDYTKYGTLLRVNPPIRDAADQVALWEGIKDGTVSMIATDHAPHLLAEKERPYHQVPSGVPGVQTILPLLLNAVNEGKLTIEKVVELCAANPAKRFGLKGKGSLEAGADADITVVDMNLQESVSRKYLWSKCGWSPFEDWDLKGWPVKTFVSGQLLYEWRDQFHEGRGKEVTVI